MIKDLITGDEYQETMTGESIQAKKEKQPGGHAGFKDYLIVILIALIAVMGINRHLYARGIAARGNSILGGLGGGCCGGAGPSLSNAEITQLGLEYYVNKTGDADVEAQLQDFGCHQEVYIIKAGEQVARLSWRDGQFSEL